MRMNGKVSRHLLSINIIFSDLAVLFLRIAPSSIRVLVEHGWTMTALTPMWLPLHGSRGRFWRSAIPIVLFHPSLHAAGPNRACCRQWRRDRGALAPYFLGA